MFPFRTIVVWLGLAAFVAVDAPADTPMRVAASAPLWTRPSSSARALGRAEPGDVLFVSRHEGEWAAVSPPDRVDLWLNTEFVENNRVLARSIQVRAGPGIQYDVVGSLPRGAPVLPRGEEGDWLKIAPPSSATLWIEARHLTPMPQRGPDTQPPPSPPAPAPAVAPAPASRPEPPPPPPVIEPVEPRPDLPTPSPAPAPASPPPPVAHQPAPPPPAAIRPSVPTVSRPPVRMPAIPHPVPVPAGTVLGGRPQDMDVAVNPNLVAELNLVNLPHQGQPIQLQGELRAAPFFSASPSRYRLLVSRGRMLETACHIHGHSPELRQLIGKQVSIRGRKYWVEQSDLPVVVVGQIVPVASATDSGSF